MTGFNPKNPNKHVGTDQFLIPFVSRNRQPTGTDYRQPETGRLYVYGTIWQVSKNPTTGVEGELWMLSKIVANIAYWVNVSSGVVGPLLKIEVDAATSPGVDPVLPDVNGLVTVTGSIVANQTIPIRTHSTALNEYGVEVQYATSSASSNPDLAGLASFNSTEFSVDANGFVSLSGGSAAVVALGVQATSGSGTNPVLADGSGKIEIDGALVAAGTNPIRSVSTAPNLLQIQAQTSQAIASVDSTKVGLSNFNSAQFSVSGGGFVSLLGAGPAIGRVIRQVFTSTGTYTPTSGMLYADIEVIGGGGGGGGVSLPGASEGGAAGGGGAGGYAKGLFTAATIGASKAVTIGAAGTGGSNSGASGTAGGTTSVGVLISATGGGAGAGSGTSSAAQITGGASGGTGTGGDFQASGSNGFYGLTLLNGSNAAGGVGGFSFLAGGGSSVGQSFGAGGAGGVAHNGDPAATGNAGKAGVVIVTEYCT